MRKLLSLSLALILFIVSFASCSSGGELSESTSLEATAQQTENETETETETAEKPSVPDNCIEIIQDNKCNYEVVAFKNYHPMAKYLKSDLTEHLSQYGIDLETRSIGSKDIDKKEIYIGKTDNFPEEALEGIDIARLGHEGFVIKVYGNKIILHANNDHALTLATDYFKRNFLDIENGKTYIPEDYCYIESNGLYLTEFLLADKNISEFTLAFDEDMETSATYLKELVYNKCGVQLTFNEEGKSKVLLTAEGAAKDTVSAKFEDGDLVIHAENADDMKKAVVCFWYENIERATGSLSLEKTLTYSRDLSQTVFYSDFNVLQSDNTCCMDDLIKAHSYANQKGYKVFADYGAKYYISSTGKTVFIKTDVEWGNAEFIIDDSVVDVNGRGNWIFAVSSDYSSYTISSSKTLERDMTNIDIKPEQKSLMIFRDSTTKHFIRYGKNADSGNDKMDTLVVDTYGSIDTDAPVMWDFDKITSITVYPIDKTTLSVGGGVFTTVANQSPIGSGYYARGIRISRSNVNVSNITHKIVGEGAQGASYSGFLSIYACAYVNVENCMLSAHKDYGAGGTYDIWMSNTVSVTFKNCSELTNILDESNWGIECTNYCKNMVYDGCVLSRIDAHCGVTNLTIKNSVLGHMGLSLTGYGTVLIENCFFFPGQHDQVIYLREDYGSWWDGDIIIRNISVCPLVLRDTKIISGRNKGEHDYGFKCCMPTNVYIDGVTSYATGNTYVISYHNPNVLDPDYSPAYPYTPSKKVHVKNLSSPLGNDIRLVTDEELFNVLFENTEIDFNGTFKPGKDVPEETEDETEIETESETVSEEQQPVDELSLLNVLITPRRLSGNYISGAISERLLSEDMNYLTLKAKGGVGDGYLMVYSGGQAVSGQYVLFKYRYAATNGVSNSTIEVFCSTVNESPVAGDNFKIPVISDGEWHIAVIDMAKVYGNAKFPANDDGSYTIKYLRIDILNAVHAAGDTVDIAYVGMESDIEDIVSLAKAEGMESIDVYISGNGKFDTYQ